MAWILFWMLLQSPSWSATFHPTALVLAIGERHKIPARGDLIVGPEKVVKAVDLKSTYELEALKAGSTEVRSGTEVYEISVLKQRQFRTYELLQKQTRKSLGLNGGVDHGDVSLQGKLLYLEEWKRIASACMNENCQYKSRFEIPARLRQQIQNHFSEMFQSLGYGIFRLRWEPEVQLLLPTSQKHSQEIEKIAAAYGLTVIQDALALELAPSIRVQIMILEIKKSFTENYGLVWPTSYAAQLVPKVESLDSLMVSANFLEHQGIAKVLASPSLLCRSGKDSEFLAGGEIPIKIMNYKLQDVVWKKYGILLRLKPTADYSGRMSLGIETEISSIDGAHTVDGIPGFFTNRVQSHFDLSEPRTIALSGLIKSEQSTDRDGILGLSHLPILGPLFSSRDFRDSRSELVILVRPEIVPAFESPQ